MAEQAGVRCLVARRECNPENQAQAPKGLRALLCGDLGESRTARKEKVKWSVLHGGGNE